MKLLKFEKDNCPACTMVENFLNDNEITAEKVNPFNNPELAAQYDIGSVPVTILLNNSGEEVDRSIGFKPDELEELISKL
ncbi:Thioredoxin [compost metagenome]